MHRALLVLSVIALICLSGCSGYRRAVRAEQYLAQAEQALEERQPAAAQALLRRAARLRPESAVLQGRVGVLLAAMGREEVALPYLERALQGPGHLPPPVLAEAVACYLGAGQEQRAGEVLLSALDRYPHDPMALNLLGYSCADQGVLLPQAQRVLERAVELAPRNGAVVDSLGWALVKQGKLQQGRVLLARADRLLPDNYEIAYHLATVALVLGDREEARTQARRSLALQPGYPPAQALLRSLR